MQGILPCKNQGVCPYGEICDQCPELSARANRQNESGGFFSQEVRITKDVHGKEQFNYSHPE